MPSSKVKNKKTNRPQVHAARLAGLFEPPSQKHPVRWTRHVRGVDVRAWCFMVLAATGAAVASPQMIGSPQAPTPLQDFRALYLRPTGVPAPADNKPSATKIDLGERLFFDRTLSASGRTSCASCHDPAKGWQDGRAKAIGDTGRPLGRKTPTILNIAWSEPLFWDGRADTLEDQAAGPLFAPDEMAMRREALTPMISRRASYQMAFARAFPGEKINLANISKAIAAYERTIISTPAPFDRWIAGKGDAISPSARRGFVLFNTKANCATCHSGWRLTDDGFHDIGLPSTDPGRAAIMPGVKVLDHAFKTPTLRNVADRSPYMHDGSIATLAQVIDHYDHGFIRRPSLADQIRPLGLTARDKTDLVAFMKTLSSGTLSTAGSTGSHREKRP